MRGVAEAASERDIGYGAMRFGRACQIGPATLQSALAQIMREIVAGAREQLLQISLRDAFHLRDACRRDVGVAQLAFDRIIDTMEQRRLRVIAERIDGARLFLTRQRQQHLGEAESDRVPGFRRQRLESLGGRLECATKHLAQATGRDNAGIPAFRQTNLTAAETLRAH